MWESHKIESTSLALWRGGRAHEVAQEMAKEVAKQAIPGRAPHLPEEMEVLTHHWEVLRELSL